MILREHVSRPARSCPLRPRGLLLLIILIAWATRLHHLAARPLWVDEAFSLWMARLPVPDLVARAARLDQHPPLYYLLLKVWTLLTGESEWAARSLSAFWGVLSVPLAFVLARRFLGRAWPAYFMATLVALSPFHVRYAQEARMYTFLAFWGLVAMWLLVEGAVSRHHAFLLGVSMVLAALSHNAGLLVSATVAVIFLLRRPPAGFTLVSWGAFAMLWLPWMPAFFHQAQGVARRFWIPWPTWRDVMAALRAFHAAYMPGREPTRWLVDGGYIALAGVGAWYVTRRDGARPAARAAAVPLVAFLLPMGLELAVSPVRPVFQPRTLIWTTFAYYLLIATGAWYVTRGRQARRVLVPVLLLVVQGAGLWGWWTRPPAEAWDRVVRHVAARARPGDLLLFNAAWTQIPFDYYAEREGLHLEEHGLPVDIAQATELEPLMREQALPRLRQLVDAHARTWLIYSHEWYTDPKELALSTLTQTFSLQGQWDFKGVRVFLFVRAGEDGRAPAR